MKQKISLVLLGILALTGCQHNDLPETPHVSDPLSTDSYRPTMIVLDPIEKELINNTNQMGFQVFNSIIENAGSIEEGVHSSNVNVSPFGLLVTTAMMANATSRPLEILDFLSSAGNQAIHIDKLNACIAKFLDTLPTVDPSSDFSSAQALALPGNDIKPNNDFKQVLHTIFDGEVFNSHDIAGLTAAVNEWGRLHTNGKIENIFPAQRPLEGPALCQAIYFNSTWQNLFDKANTIPQQFKLASGEKVQTAMMHLTLGTLYSTVGDLTIITLPYGNGNYELNLIQLAGNESDFAQELDFTTYNSLLQARSYGLIELGLPRFHSETYINLEEYLGQNGYGAMIESELFDKMVIGGTASFNTIMQSVDMVVEEEGTSMASSTVAGLCTSTGETEPEKLIVNLDSPFVYVLQETTTNLILTLGILNNPTAN